MSPVSEAGILTKSTLSSVSDKIYDSIAEGETLSELKAENAKLKSQIVSSEKYKLEAERLQKILDLKDQYQAEGITAHVISASNSAWNQIVTISAGSNDGISAGQTVFAINGVIGQVDSTHPFSSTVRLLSDPNSGVAVKLVTSEADCILKGSLDSVLYLEGLDINENVQVGDAVVTSGLGGSFVQGLTVGSVSQIISSENGVNRKIVVTPLDTGTNISEVFVIRETK